jgi:hypothetical protein
MEKGKAQSEKKPFLKIINRGPLEISVKRVPANHKKPL